MFFGKNDLMQGTESKNSICERCGELGHTKEQCPKNIEEILEIDKEIRKNSEEIAASIKSQLDDFYDAMYEA